jgi:hypothetical protein
VYVLSQQSASSPAEVFGLRLSRNLREMLADCWAAVLRRWCGTNVGIPFHRRRFGSDDIAEQLRGGLLR